MTCRYHYEVRNASGALIAVFGADYRAACACAKSREGCGLMYGLRVCRFRVSATA